MTYEVWADAGFQKELGSVDEAERSSLMRAVRALAQNPARHPQTKRLMATGYPGSFWLRVGRWRILGIALEIPQVVLLTTMFVKKRPIDYTQALRRHEQRLRRQGPPLAEYVRRTKRR